MKTTLSDFVIAFLDLMEAEGRTLKEATMRVGWGMAFVALAAIFILIAGGFLLWGIYQQLLTVVSQPAAAMLISLSALILAAISGLIAKKITRNAP